MKEKIFKQVFAKEVNPLESGWYDTDKGNLYWLQQETCWSCRDEYLSEEYPKYWYEVSQSTPMGNDKEITDDDIEELLNDYETYCKTFVSKELIQKYIKQRHNG